MKIVFMGTPDFAVPSLKGLVENHYNVIAVVTQVDKPAGRGHALKASPVKEYAIANGIAVIQPEKLSKQPEYVAQLRSLEPDLFITCAFGQFLPQSVLDIPRLGTINVHGSLLPKYRGAAPIQWSVINGDKVTGITTMLTNIGMDTGDMLLKETIEIPDDMTAGELFDRMSLLGADTLIKTLKLLETDSLTPIKQNDAESSHAPRITKETGCIQWHKSSQEIYNLIRGTNPWPGAYTFYDNMKMRVWRSLVPMNVPEVKNDAIVGTILRVDAEGLLVKTGDGALLITEIQFESGKRMTPWVYCCGHSLETGRILGGNTSDEHNQPK